MKDWSCATVVLSPDQPTGHPRPALCQETLVCQHNHPYLTLTEVLSPDMGGRKWIMSIIEEWSQLLLQ